jgi:hypothetical protein
LLITFYYFYKDQSLRSLSFSTDQYLTHYWPIKMGKMLDEIGSAHMTQGALTSFIEDRFGCPYSALALNGGWTQVPPGIYFDTPEFTITVWIYPQQVGLWARVIDFGSGPAANNIFLSQYSTPTFRIYTNLIYVIEAASAISLHTNKWQFIAVTFNSNSSRIYFDGQLTIISNQSFTLYRILNRTNCFIGKSNWAGDGYSYSYLDDLRFYNKSLSQGEIVELMNYQNLTSMKIQFLFFIFESKNRIRNLKHKFQARHELTRILCFFVL